MEGRMRLLFLIVLGTIWSCDATGLTITEQSRNSFLCQLCEQYGPMAVDYLKDTKTQNQIAVFVHNICHNLPSYDEECTGMVNKYLPIVFSQIGKIPPEELCRLLSNCPGIPKISSSQVQQNTSAICKSILVKVTYPESQIEIIRALLNACNNTEELAEKCKRAVFKYGPWAMSYAEKFLRKTDICTELHLHVGQASIIEENPLLSDS